MSLRWLLGLIGGPRKEAATRPAHLPPPDPAHGADLIIEGTVDSLDIVGFCDRVDLVLRDGRGQVLCDVSGLSGTDLGTIAALARLQLIALQRGARITLRDAPAELHDVLALLGLCDVVGVCTGLGVEVERQAEERKDVGGVEEECDAADPIA